MGTSSKSIDFGHVFATCCFSHFILVYYFESTFPKHPSTSARTQRKGSRLQQLRC